jgi:protein gp37
MSDLFLKEIPVSFIRKVFDVMERTLTGYLSSSDQASGPTLELSRELPWTGNIWMGATVENGDYVHRIDCLRKAEPVSNSIH